nr:hypothetical protein Q903MT_gene1731 [Picea sitchensis]
MGPPSAQQPSMSVGLGTGKCSVRGFHPSIHKGKANKSRALSAYLIETESRVKLERTMNLTGSRLIYVLVYMACVNPNNFFINLLLVLSIDRAFRFHRSTERLCIPGKRREGCFLSFRLHREPRLPNRITTVGARMNLLNCTFSPWLLCIKD